MKATCPSCSTSYRVAEEKVPDAGAQIKCPKCNMLFVVRRPPGPAPKPVAPAHEQSTPLHALTGESPAPAAPAPAPALKEPPVTPEKADPARKARGMSAIRAQSGVKAPAPEAQAPMTDSYRVRTQKGLTYDFSTREAMARWLRERDDLTGCEASEPGGDWHPAHEFIEALQLSDGTVAPAAPAAGAGFPARPGLAPRPKLTLRPASPEAGVLLWAAVGLTALLVVLITAATLTRYGVVDLSPYLPLEAVGIQMPGKSSGTDNTGVPEAAGVGNPEKVFKKAIDKARQSIRAKRFSRAALEYNRALSIRPNSVEALEGLAKAYSGLGDRDRADAVLKKVQSTKGE